MRYFTLTVILTALFVISFTANPASANCHAKIEAVRAKLDLVPKDNPKRQKLTRMINKAEEFQNDKIKKKKCGNILKKASKMLKGVLKQAKKGGKGKSEDKASQSVISGKRGTARPGGGKWRGSIIDAHSQFGCEISANELSGVIKKHGLAHTLLSARGCKNESVAQSHSRVLELVEDLGGQASFLISTKLGGMTKAGSRNGFMGINALSEADNAYSAKAVGFAEIIIQHAPHDTKLLVYEGLKLDFRSYRIEKAVALALRHTGPVILHVELKDSSSQAERIIGQLKELLNQNPDHNFLLIHLGQSSVAQARDLIENYKNIYFLTSHADTFSEISMEIGRRENHKAQIGWINLFNDPPKGAPYKKWLVDYLPTMQWRDDWKKLVEGHPDRFVFAMDNVFGPHWTKMYRNKLIFWRKAFSGLSKKSAILVACANAKRLWRLEVQCQSQ